MKFMRFISTILILFLCVSLTGCGDGTVRVSGTVSFPDNSPLTVGAVIFANDTYTNQSALNSSGRYSINVPPGNYKIFIGYASVRDETFVPPPNDPDAVRHISLVHSMFASLDETPLICDITRGGAHNFTVENPEEQ